jgi:hypothetical protein
MAPCATLRRRAAVRALASFAGSPEAFEPREDPDEAGVLVARIMVVAEIGFDPAPVVAPDPETEAAAAASPAPGTGAGWLGGS